MMRVGRPCVSGLSLTYCAFTCRLIHSVTFCLALLWIATNLMYSCVKWWKEKLTNWLLFVGKWATINFWQVKVSYFRQLIKDLNALLDNVKNASHRRKPMYEYSTRRLSFKAFELSRVQIALNKQYLVKLKTKVLFSSRGEIAIGCCQAKSLRTPNPASCVKSSSHRQMLAYG